MHRTRVGILTTVPAAVFLILTILTGYASGAQVVPPVALVPLNQIVVPEPPNLFQYVKNKAAAIRLGKAFFWDMQVGSDGVTACATCHFSAGADNRLKNTLNPGTNALDTIFDIRGPNQTLLGSDFPFHQRQAPVDFKASPVFRDANDVVGSQGVRLNQLLNIAPNVAEESGSPIADSIFNVSGVNVRQVTGRNTPSVINSIFNFSNFWDGRASSFFNGSSPFGPLDQNAGIWVDVNGTLTKQQVSMVFASLASQATGPPLSDVEMSFRGRTFPQLGKKMLGLTPLGKQLVHPDDSELGNLSNATIQIDGTVSGSKGLHTSYEQMIKDAFQAYLWNSASNTQDGFSQMEANFPLFWGLAIQLYEATLIADDTPFDRFLGGNGTALTPQQQDGFNIFFGAGRCDVCHGATELTNASVRASRYITNADHGLLELMPVASGQQIIYDNGFNNTAVRPTTEDVCRAGTSPFDNPLTGAKFPLSFSDLAELQALNKLPFSTPVLIAGLPATFPVANGGAFKVPGLRNVELTAPFMHNGSMMTLEEVVEFYARGGNFPTANKASLDINIVELPALQGEPAAQAALVAFMKSMTDERVRNSEAPFDHPEIFIPNGDSVNDTDMIHLPAIGMMGAPPTPSVTVTTDLVSPQSSGTPVRVTASATGGSGFYEYEFWKHDGTSWTKVQPYSPTATWDWNTTNSGGYATIQVNARNAGSAAQYETFASVTYQIIPASATGSSLFADKTSPQPSNTQNGITFTAGGSGGSGTYEYEYWLHDGTAWSKVRAYSTTNNWIWNTSAASAGTYTVQVNVRSQGSPASFESWQAMGFQITPAAASSVSLLADKTSPQLASTLGGVTFTANATGGTGPYEYEFWRHDGTSWTNVQPFSTNNTLSWDTSAAVGFYTIQVNARSAGSSAAFEAYNSVIFKIETPTAATGATLVADKITPQPATTPGGVVYTASGQGTGPFEYEFYLHNGTAWSNVQAMSTTSTWAWDTSIYAPGTYTIQVNVRTVGSSSSYETWQTDVFTLQ